MNEKHYLFIFRDGSTYDMTCGVSFKDAFWEMCKYTDQAEELLRKCLTGFDSDDIEGITSIFRYFGYKDISKIYIIEKKLYDEDEI